MSRRHRGSSVLDNDDLLWEILFRLSPQPSSLPRASAVCKRWRRLATDPGFLRKFYKHHRKIVGVFEWRNDKIVFTPLLEPPDRIFPPLRLELGGVRWDGQTVLSSPRVLGCRHGRVLIGNYLQRQVIVCDLITGERCRVAIPSEFRRAGFYNPAVLCAAGDHDQGHVHGACHSSPFKLILVSMWSYDNQKAIACVYSSETGAWGNLISSSPSLCFDAGKSGSLVGNALYWLCTNRDQIVEFDLEKHSLAVITGPPIAEGFCSCHIIRGEDDGAIGFAVLSFSHFQMWQRKNSNGHDVPTWVLWKNIQLHHMLELPPNSEIGFKTMSILGYSEDTDEIFIDVKPNVYMVQLKSMQSKRLYETNDDVSNYHPFTSF